MLLKKRSVESIFRLENVILDGAHPFHEDLQIGSCVKDSFFPPLL